MNPSSTMSPPLVTFVVIAYNQQAFVEQAIAGAFSQTYSPLEIILSDDCSPDRTFDLMKQAANDYQGPHEVVLNRNASNLGLVGHVNKALSQARGRFVVVAGGDDISLPERTTRLVDQWTNDQEVLAVYSDACIIDEQGSTMGNWFQRTPKPEFTLDSFLESGYCYVLGCANSIDKRVMEVFGDIPTAVRQEDWVLPFRAALLGKVKYVDAPLVQYRRHSANTWQPKDAVVTRRLVSRRKFIYRTWLQDLEQTEHPKKTQIRTKIKRLMFRNRVESLVRSVPFLGTSVLSIRLVLKRTLKRVWGAFHRETAENTTSFK